MRHSEKFVNPVVKLADTFDFQKLLTGRAEVTGQVISMANGMAQVATNQGVVEVVLDGDSNVGDRVSVRDGRALRVQEAVEVPVFFV